MNEFKPIRFGKYLLLDKVAMGGMAELYRAKITGEEGFEKVVAIKRILPHLASEKDLVNSFIDEAKLAALLHHNNIAQIFDFGSLEGTYFITMEYLFGKDLSFFIKRSKNKNLPVRLEHALFIVSRICAGLDYAHKLKNLKGKPINLIHRDISPQNVFLTYEGDVKLLDFGIAKAAIRSTVTEIGMIKGKVAYMSPEQAAGKTIDHRSDIFSTGILLYEMVTGKRMYKGDTLQILSQVCEAKFDPPESAIDGQPPKVYEIIHRSLKKEPEQRYQTCGEMLVALQECTSEIQMQTTARSFAQHIKTIFKKEITAEEKQIKREAAWIEPTVEPEIDKGKTISFAEPGHETPPPTGAHNLIWQLKKKLTKKFLLPTAGSVLILILLVFLIFPRQKDRQASDTVVEPPKGQSTVQTQHTNNLTISDRGSQRPISREKTPTDKLITSDRETQKPVSRKKDTTDRSAYFLEQAKQAYNNQNYEKALPLFEQAFHLEPSLKKKYGPKVYNIYVTQGKGLIGKSNREAVSLLETALKYNPEGEKALFYLGFAFIQLGSPEKAEGYFKKVIEHNPLHHKAYFNLGYLYLEQEKYTNAINQLSKVIELRPDYLADAYVNLGITYYKMDKDSLAREAFSKALEIDHNNDTAKKYLYYLDRR